MSRSIAAGFAIEYAFDRGYPTVSQLHAKRCAIPHPARASLNCRGSGGEVVIVIP